MLIQLTQKCNEGCLHCMVDATPKGKSMDWDIVKRTVEYLKLVKPNLIVISGGEFTLADDWYDKLWYFIDNLNCRFTLQSNGWWMREDYQSMSERQDAENTKFDFLDFLDSDKVVNVQISTSKKFYPNYDKIIALKDKFEKLKKVKFVADWQGEGFNPLDPNKFDKTNLVNLGRATNYFVDGETPKGNPGCFSLLIRAKTFNDKINTPEFKEIRKKKLTDFQSFLYHLYMEGRFCKPMINIDGTIHIGETQFCLSFDNVNNYFDETGKRYNQVECYRRIQKQFEILKKLPICNLCKSKHNINPIILENFNF